MSHMVIYRGSDGKPGYHQVDDIHDAVSFVEEMRNNDGVDHARIFRLEEVTFEFKPYYRVEIGGAATAAASADSDEDARKSVVEIESADESDEDGDDSANGHAEEESAEVIDDEASEDTDEEEAGTGARRGLFGR